MAVLVAGLLAAAIPGATAGASTTTTVPLVPLEPLVMRVPFSGFTATPAGPLNGPLTASTWESYSSDPAAAAAQFRQLESSNGFAAFVRDWRDARSPTQDMNVVVSLVFRIPDTSVGSSFVAHNVRSLEAPTTQRWNVASIPGAQGLTFTDTTPVRATENLVVFRTGIYVVIVQLISSVGPGNTRPFTIADAISVAYDQYALVAVAPGGGRPVPTAPPRGGSGGGAVLGVVIAALILAVLGAGTWWVLQRRRAAIQAGDAVIAAALEPLGAVDAPAVDSAPAVPVPDLAGHPEEAGWRRDPSGDPDRVRYWDGTSWTSHTAVRQQ